MPPSRAKRQREDGAEFADGKDGDERKRVHAADVGLAVGNVHGAPQEAGAGGGENAACGTAACGPLAVHGAEAEHDGRGNDGERAEHDFGDVLGARAFQFAEQQAAPEDADERVGVPQGEGDGQADVANGEDRKRIGDGPQHAGEDGDGDEVLVFGRDRRRLRACL